MFGSNAGILAVVEYLKEIAVILVSGDKKIIYSVGGIIVELTITVAASLPTVRVEVMRELVI